MTPDPAALPVHLADREQPFWGFAELLVVAAMFILASIAAGAAIQALGGYLHFNAQLGAFLLLAEALSYGVVFLVLWALFARYGKPLFESLAWVPHNFKPLHLVVTGFILAIVVVILGNLLGFPNQQTPFDKLLTDAASRYAIAIFGVSIGPVIEELLFRGFLQPLMINTAGVFYGILSTSVVFGLLHLTQNANQWRSGALITLVGFVLGVIRHISGSTRASAITHVSYNALPFVVLLITGKT